MLKLNKSIFFHTCAASMMVVYGVVSKNSASQLKLPQSHPLGMLGTALFVIGWLYTAYALSLMRKNKVLFVVFSLLILSAVMIMKRYMINKMMPPMILPAIFALSWIGLGYITSMHLKGSMKWSGLLVSALVITSMMKILPMQRKLCVVDGPGFVMFSCAWMILTVLNSMR